ncbi:MAG: hypothetical protein LLF76_02745 [Planctomycetaceae bacterium]|nr:hypothetical protein [Planctomycetaceae bacterium]
MAAWTTTVADIRSSIEHLYHRLTKTPPTYMDARLIADAVQEAMVAICLERGDSRWQFLRAECQMDCVAGQTYIDLPADAIRVIEGTVRIPDRDATLYATSLEALLASDPAREVTGLPALYAFDNAGGDNLLRLQLSPVPDQAYAVYCYVEEVVDTAENAPFPLWMKGMVTDLSTAIAMRRLGLGGSGEYMAAYLNASRDLAGKLGHDGPQFIPRQSTIYTSNLQSRTPR